MTMNTRVRRFTSAIVAFILLSFTGGCSYTVRPAQVPLASGGPAIALSGTNVLVVNAEKNPDEAAIASERGGRSGLKANRQEWSRKLTESLAGELARRGAQVRSTSKLVMTVSLPEILFTQNREASRFTVKALVNSSTGWSKTYEGIAKAEELSTPAAADKLAAQALADAIRAMLADSEFQAQLVKR